MKKSNILIFLFAFIFSCTSLPEGPDDVDNPFDPNSPNYELPQVNITEGPVNESIISEDEVTFRWTGNRQNMEFRYRLADEPWSEYSSANSATYDFLDEGDHIFHVQGRYITGVEGNIHQVSFSVDAIKAPALYLTQKRNNLFDVYSFPLDLKIELEDLVSIMYVRINYDPDAIQVDSVVYDMQMGESFWLQNGGELITFKNIDNENGIIELDCAVYQGNPRDVSGSGNIARLFLRQISEMESIIRISEESECRNSTNSQVVISHFGSAKVIVY